MSAPNLDAIGISRDSEHLPTVIYGDHDAIASALAERIIEIVDEATRARGRCVLGLATGSTPIGVYRQLVQRHQRGEVDLRSVVTFNLDEYYPMAPASFHSYHRYMHDHLFDHVNVEPSHIHIPDGTVSKEEIADHCAAYEQAIDDAGGIDFLILGIGRSGHIGFNEPGSSPDSRTRVITLDTITRRDAAADFFGEGNVPTQALTMGIATILSAREIALVATGEHKAPIVHRTVEGDRSPHVTATYLQQHANATVHLDLAAAGALTRVQTPWLLEDVEWTAARTDDAVVWLAGQTDKAILKLTAQDYRDQHLSPLLSRHPTAGAINGMVFNRIAAKIRGRRKLPAGRRVLVFSPHPDDDVISMGGILRKLQQNENEIVVAYMTSGNIAVFDHDVSRHLDFIVRAATTLGLSGGKAKAAAQRIHAEFAGKQPGDIDVDEVQYLKQFIRESEAVSALADLGIPSGAARFLDMPFYRTGQIQKRPIGQEDIQIVHGLLDTFQPELVFVAGDLSDPHGTHRVCKAAIDTALEEFDGSPEIWLYRGAWQEWPVTEASVLVPLSQDELHAKIFAIFKHQSQKDTAPFPGGADDREFWQRVEARNMETAATADRLGLAEYYAMEAYRIDR